MGFAVRVHPYMQHCRDHPQYPPTSLSLQLMWSSSILEGIGQSYGEKLKENVVFFARSLLTPVVYSPRWDSSLQTVQPSIDIVKEIEQAYSVSNVLCRADPIVVKQRLGARYTFASDEDKDLMDKLRETDKTWRRARGKVRKHMICTVA